MHPGGKSKAEIVWEIPEAPDPDTFYIHIMPCTNPKPIYS